MFLGCMGCGMGAMPTVPGIDPKVQQMVIIGAVSAVVLGIGFYLFMSRQKGA